MLHKKRKKLKLQQEDFAEKLSKSQYFELDVNVIIACQTSHLQSVPLILSFTDLRKLYMHPIMDPDKNPTTLQNKVQWDLHFYIARRANENIEQFTKGTFQLKKHADSSLRYIVKIYEEQTKNHQMDLNDIDTACMVEVPDSKYCPVASFMKYKSHLSPLIPDLWQYPKEQNWETSDVWYTNKKIRANPLSTFMSRISYDAELSKIYLH